MIEIDSGKTYRYRVVQVSLDIQTAVPILTLVVAQGTVDAKGDFSEVARQEVAVPADDAAQLFAAAPIDGLLQKWMQYLLDKGVLQGTLLQ
jgi:hypothetical protein